MEMPAWSGKDMNRRGRMKRVVHRHFKEGDPSKEKREVYLLLFLWLSSNVQPKVTSRGK